MLPPAGQQSNYTRWENKASEQKLPGVGSGKCAKCTRQNTKEQVQRKTACKAREGCPERPGSGREEAVTWRLMKLEVVSEDVLPSERLKRLLRLGNFLGSCGHREDTRLISTRCFPRSSPRPWPEQPPHPPKKTEEAARAPTGPADELGYKCTSAPGFLPYGASQRIKHSLTCHSRSFTCNNEHIFHF